MVSLLVSSASALGALGSFHCNFRLDLSLLLTFKDNCIFLGKFALTAKSVTLKVAHPRETFVADFTEVVAQGQMLAHMVFHVADLLRLKGAVLTLQHHLLRPALLAVDNMPGKLSLNEGLEVFI